MCQPTSTTVDLPSIIRITGRGYSNSSNISSCYYPADISCSATLPCIIANCNTFRGTMSFKITFGRIFYHQVCFNHSVTFREHEHFYPHMPIGKVWIYCLLCVRVFVRLRISPPWIKLAASHFARRSIGVQGRNHKFFVNFAPPEAQNRTNRPACALNYKQNWKEPSLACRLRLTEVRAAFYL